jgi:hypothetical protein
MPTPPLLLPLSVPKLFISGNSHSSPFLAAGAGGSAALGGMPGRSRYLHARRAANGSKSKVSPEDDACDQEARVLPLRARVQYALANTFLGHNLSMDDFQSRALHANATHSFFQSASVPLPRPRATERFPRSQLIACAVARVDSARPAAAGGHAAAGIRDLDADGLGARQGRLHRPRLVGPQPVELVQLRSKQLQILYHLRRRRLSGTSRRRPFHGLARHRPLHLYVQLNLSEAVAARDHTTPLPATAGRRHALTLCTLRCANAAQRESPKVFKLWSRLFYPYVVIAYASCFIGLLFFFMCYIGAPTCAVDTCASTRTCARAPLCRVLTRRCVLRARRGLRNPLPALLHRGHQGAVARRGFAVEVWRPSTTQRSA